MDDLDGWDSSAGDMVVQPEHIKTLRIEMPGLQKAEACSTTKRLR